MPFQMNLWQVNGDQLIEVQPSRQKGVCQSKRGLQIAPRGDGQVCGTSIWGFRLVLAQGGVL